MTRGKVDFIILRDDDKKDKQAGMENQMLHKLKLRSLTGSVLNEKYIPGINKDDTFRSMISDADFVICMFDKNSVVSPAYIDKLSRSHKMKSDQGIDGHIIPVFCGSSFTEADDLTENYSKLRFLNMYGAAYTLEDGWLDKMVKTITTPPLGKTALLYVLTTTACFMCSMWEWSSAMISHKQVFIYKLECNDYTFCYVYSQLKLHALPKVMLLILYAR